MATLLHWNMAKWRVDISHLDFFLLQLVSVDIVLTIPGRIFRACIDLHLNIISFLCEVFRESIF